MPNRSTFVAPNYTVDDFAELFDLSPNQLQDAERYQILKRKSNKTQNEITELNNLTQTLKNHLITPERWNHFADALTNMQIFIKDNVEGYIQVKQQEFQAEIDKFANRGEWVNTTQYFKKNIVTFNGQSYLAKQDNLNKIPTEALYWQLIAERGAKGDPSLNIYYRGNYNHSAQYELGDAVIYNGVWYYAKTNTVGNIPTNSAFWEIEPKQIYISNIAPFDTRIRLWLDTN